MTMLQPKQARSHATRLRLLDAAVEVLAEGGYGAISTSSVARRAGVSRGAHQHHFPNREAMVIEAVRHMSSGQLAELRERIARLPRGARRVAGALDHIFALYSGTFFAAILELSLAARHEEGLRAAVAEEEREMARTIQQLGAETLGEEAMADPDLAHRWTLSIATIRGLALLRVLQHSEATIRRQWRIARLEILARLEHPVDAASVP